MFTKGVDRLMKGYRDQNFDDCLVEFICNIALEDLTEEEMAIFYS